MKKEIFTSVLVLLGFTVSAQLEWGKLGMNVSTVKVTSDVPTITTNPKTGYRIGANIYVPISNKLDLDINLLHSLKGFNTKNEVLIANNNLVETISQKRTHLGYIEAPIGLRFHTQPKNENLFFATLGSYYSLLVFAVDKQRFLEDDKKKMFTEPLSIGNSTSNTFKRHDGGVYIAGGVEFGLIQVSAEYQLGLMNIATDQSENTSVFNRSFVINLSIRN